MAVSVAAGDQRGIVEHIIRSNAWFMSVLAAARACNPPDWYVGGGAIRTIVWDYLHGYDEPTPLADVDVGFFDPLDLSPARDEAVETELRAVLPGVPWQAKNQAAVHLWYERVFGYAVAPLTSSRTPTPRVGLSMSVTVDEDPNTCVTVPTSPSPVTTG